MLDNHIYNIKQTNKQIQNSTLNLINPVTSYFSLLNDYWASYAVPGSILCAFSFFFVFSFLNTPETLVDKISFANFWFSSFFSES